MKSLNVSFYCSAILASCFRYHRSSLSSLFAFSNDVRFLCCISLSFEFRSLIFVFNTTLSPSENRERQKGIKSGRKKKVYINPGSQLLYCKNQRYFPPDEYVTNECLTLRSMVCTRDCFAKVYRHVVFTKKKRSIPDSYDKGIYRHA